MTYPLDLSHLEKGAVPILQVALDLHMVCNGSSDVIPSSDVHQVLMYLRVKCQQWTPTPDTNNQSFDAAVLALLQAAIADGDRWMAARDRDQAEDEETHAHDDDRDPEHPDDRNMLDWEDEPGCGIPDQCLVIGEHRHSDCHTAATVEAHDQAMREAESVATTTDRF